MIFGVGYIIIFTTVTICILSQLSQASSPWSQWSAQTSSASTAETPRYNRRRQTSSENEPENESPEPTSNYARALPNTPNFDTVAKCTGWIELYLFQNDTYANIARARSYDLQFDINIHFWVASYVYGLFRPSNDDLFRDPSTTNYVNPSTFCMTYAPGSAYFQNISLKAATYSCEGWINFYGYSCSFDKRNRHHVNLVWVIYRDLQIDPFISIWAVTYFRYISSSQERAQILPERFCSGIGHMVAPLPTKFPFLKMDNSPMAARGAYNKLNPYNTQKRSRENEIATLKFMNLNGTRLKCQEWIYLYGYLEEEGYAQLNYLKANEINPEFDNFIAFWAKQYINYLKGLASTRTNIMSPMTFCHSHRTLDLTRYNFVGNAADFTWADFDHIV